MGGLRYTGWKYDSQDHKADHSTLQTRFKHSSSETRNYQNAGF